MRNYILRAIDWLYKYSERTTFVLLLCFSIIDISNLDEFKFCDLEVGKIFYYFCIVGCLIAGFVSIENKKLLTELENGNRNISEQKLQLERDLGRKINDLEENLTEIINDSQQLFNTYLRFMIINQNLTFNERVSVYKMHNGRFIMLGRASENAVLSQKRRTSYLATEGFISIGWANGEFHIENLPNPSNFGEYYEAINEHCAVSRDELATIRMKARNFYIKRLNGYSGEPKAIIVFESLLPNSLNKDELSLYLSDVNSYLINFIEKLNFKPSTVENSDETNF